MKVSLRWSKHRSESPVRTKSRKQNREHRSRPRSKHRITAAPCPLLRRQKLYQRLVRLSMGKYLLILVRSRCLSEGAHMTITIKALRAQTPILNHQSRLRKRRSNPRPALSTLPPHTSSLHHYNCLVLVSHHSGTRLHLGAGTLQEDGGILSPLWIMVIIHQLRGMRTLGPR
jgi:hypothetical protein